MKIDIFDPVSFCRIDLAAETEYLELRRLANWLKQLHEQGVMIKRYNLTNDPLAFTTHEQLIQLMIKSGENALPAVFIDDVLWIEGAYPSDEMFEAFFKQYGYQKIEVKRPQQSIKEALEDSIDSIIYK